MLKKKQVGMPIETDIQTVSVSEFCNGNGANDLIRHDFIFGLTPSLSLNLEIRGRTWLLGEPLRLRGKEVVFFEEWLGFEPGTSSIRRGRSFPVHHAPPGDKAW